MSQAELVAYLVVFIPVAVAIVALVMALRAAMKQSRAVKALGAAVSGIHIPTAALTSACRFCGCSRVGNYCGACGRDREGNLTDPDLRILPVGMGKALIWRAPGTLSTPPETNWSEAARLVMENLKRNDGIIFVPHLHAPAPAAPPPRKR